MAGFFIGIGLIFVWGAYVQGVDIKEIVLDLGFGIIVCRLVVRNSFNIYPFSNYL